MGGERSCETNIGIPYLLQGFTVQICTCPFPVTPRVHKVKCIPLRREEVGHSPTIETMVLTHVTFSCQVFNKGFGFVLGLKYSIKWDRVNCIAWYFHSEILWCTNYTAGMKFSSFAVAAVLLLVLAAHTCVTDAAAFGEVSITEAYRLKQEPWSQYSNPMIIYNYFPTVTQ